ncbi:hypothetical protein H634G_08928 [Metarhizium anisopliae BRIP 53293]|uniref:Amine oxidase n=1 Tax=Metarhizium anisopliae BRIP 53293 TaxID=1291518 RepID=A0A0D9NNQ7_METAN|nr:hypothetical protein H634G_08928 [Metarhizium anisopliae BRIP 53293]KJK92780.1 hypothetical protein H633G_03337 [Metarhizium anisopliae BRIP 53284]
MATTQIDNLDVVIVGAGLSGLRAAREIHAAGLKYVVLEAMDRVGGKTLSVPASSKGTGVVDLGAAWINDTNQSEMYSLAQEFSFDLVKQRDEGDSVVRAPDGKIDKVPYGMLAKLEPEQLERLMHLLQKIGELAEKSNTSDPSLTPNAETLDSVSLHDFVADKFKNEDANTLVNELVKALVGLESSYPSALYFLDTVKRAAGLANMISDGKNGGQYLRNRQGNQSFSVEIARGLTPGAVKLSSPVTSITQSATGCVVESKTGDKYTAKKVIMSLPSCLLPTVQFSPGLPQPKQLLSQSTKLGYYSKTILVFEEPWWLAADLSGVYTSTGTAISFTRDTCVPEDGQYSITCFHTGETGRSWSRLSAEERRTAVLAEFKTAFETATGEGIPDPVNVIEKEWTKDPWALGAPSPVMPPGLLTSEAGKALYEPFQNIHFVGTETADVWRGYMEGAVRSGLRGAREVIDALGSSSTR